MPSDEVEKHIGDEVKKPKGFMDEVSGYVKGAVAGGLIAMASSEEALSADKGPQPKPSPEKPKAEKKAEAGKVKKFPLPNGGFKVETETRNASGDKVIVTTYEGLNSGSNSGTNTVSSESGKKSTTKETPIDNKGGKRIETTGKNDLGDTVITATYEGVKTGPSEPAKIFSEKYQKILEAFPDNYSTDLSTKFKALFEKIKAGGEKVKTGEDYKNFLDAVGEAMSRELGQRIVKTLSEERLSHIEQDKKVNQGDSRFFRAVAESMYGHAPEEFAKTLGQSGDLLQIAKDIEELAKFIDDLGSNLTNQQGAKFSQDGGAVTYWLRGVCCDLLKEYERRLKEASEKKFQF